jgi:ribonuclease HII
MLKPYKTENTLEVGIDECARGCLLGSVFIGAVILPENIEELCEEFGIKIKDSKKMTREQREEAYEFITMVCIDYAVISKTNDEIDNINILKATLTGMHDVIRSLKIKPEKILVDGDKFYIYRDDDGELIEHECVIKGDDTYMSIAAASIIAKVEHDRYILKLVEEYPYLEKYDIQNNMAYGSKKHLLAITEYGLTKFHRKTFGICKSYGVNDLF